MRDISQYCTLSYRWDTTSHDCILRAPLHGHIEIMLDSMPKTFQDAIETARGLDIRFLWIDALCIVQPVAFGDSTDWHSEGSRMGLLYQNALFNIAATYAKSVADGFLSEVGSSPVGFLDMI